MMKSGGVFCLADQAIRNFHPRVHQTTRKRVRRSLKSCWALRCVQPGITSRAVTGRGADSTRLTPLFMLITIIELGECSL
jgi:hypothetical protein